MAKPIVALEVGGVAVGLREMADAEALSGIALPWALVTGAPATFTPSAHTHSWSEITSGVPATFAPSAHTHPASEITGATFTAGTYSFAGSVIEGSLTLDIGTGTFLVQNGATMFQLNGATGQVGIGAAPETDVGVLLNTPERTISDNIEYDRFYVKDSGPLRVTPGTTSIRVSTARFDEPNITMIGAGTGVVTTAATVYISGAPTEGVSNYALLVESGITKFGGAVEAASTVGVTGVVTAGGFAGPLNGTVGATTPAAGAFTTGAFSGDLFHGAAAATHVGFNTLLPNPGGSTTVSTVTIGGGPTRGLGQFDSHSILELAVADGTVDGDNIQINEIDWVMRGYANGTKMKVAAIEVFTHGTAAGDRGGKLQLDTKTDGGALAAVFSVGNDQKMRFTQQVLAPSGSVSAPSHSFDGTENTGWYLQGTAMSASMAGAEVVRILPAGIRLYGHLGFGVDPVATTALRMAQTINGGTALYGFQFDPIFGTDGTSTLRAAYMRVRTADGARNTTDIYGCQIAAPSLGASHTVTNAYGLYIGAVTVGSSANWSIYTETGNWTMAALSKFYFDGGSNTYIHESAADTVQIVTGGTARLTVSVVGLGVGGSATRATTAGTNAINLFNGTPPVGTLTNGVSFYSAAGEAYAMDAAGNATLLSPHDSLTNEWIFKSKHTPTGRVLRIRTEALLNALIDAVGLDRPTFISEYLEAA